MHPPHLKKKEKEKGESGAKVFLVEKNLKKTIKRTKNTKKKARRASRAVNGKNQIQ